MQLSTISLALTRLGGAFDPSSLFAGGTAGAWYDPSDLSTLFTTSAGTTQCAMPGQGSAVSVGAMLDKRATGYSNYFDGTGDYLSFASDSGLALGAGQYTVELWVHLTASVNFGVFFSVTGGLQFSTNASNNVAVALQGVAFQLESTTPVTLNQWAHLAVTRDSGNTTRIFLNGSQIASAVITTNYGQGVSYANFNSGLPGAHHTGYYANLRVVKGTAVYTGAFTPPTAPLSPITGTSLLTCGTTWSGNPAITTVGNTRVDGLNPFTASPVGNHAIAFNDTTARPELRARVNLLTYSEEFDNGAWGKSNTTVTSNSTVAPDGTTTADTAVTANGTFSANSVGVGQNLSWTTTEARTFLFSAKSNGLRFAQCGVHNGAGFTATIGFDLQTGAVAASGGNYCTFSNASILSQGSGWFRCSVTITPTSTDLKVPYIAGSSAMGGVNNRDATGDGTSGIYIWGADLRPANIGANVPAYQRIADANTYDTSGFPLYLRFDGIDDSMYTPANLNLSGTDKVSVFAGVRKLSDASIGVAMETSINSGNNDGALMLTTSGQVTPGAKYGSTLRGTALIYAETATAYAAPRSDVLALINDIAQSTAATEQIMRINGAQVALTFVGADAGTGNLGNHRLFIGSRNSASAWLNGHLHSLIIAGSAVSAGNINATEQWVAGKTGLVLP